MRKVALKPGDGDPRHGDNGYGNYRCRCVVCTAAWRERQYGYMERHPEQQRKKRDRTRRDRGHSEEAIARLEMDYRLVKGWDV